MSFTLPDGTVVAGHDDNGFVQHSADLALLDAVQAVEAAVTAQTARIDLVTAATQQVRDRLTTDPPTGAALAALRGDVQATTAKLPADPATSTAVAALGSKLDAILAKQPATPATSADLASVVSAVNAVTAKIPAGAATDAHIDLVTTAINAAASVLPTGAASSADLATATAAINAVTAKLPTTPALQTDVQAVRDRLPAALVGGRLAVDPSSADQVVSGTLSAVNDAVTLTRRDGDVSASIELSGTFTGVTVAFFSINSAGTQRTLLMTRTDAAAVGTSGVTAGQVWTAALPPGASGVRAVLTGISTGSVNVNVSSTKQAAPSNVNIAGGLLQLNALTISPDATGTLQANAAGFLFNGANWDRARGNVYTQGAASAARTTTLTSGDLTTYNYRGFRLVLNVSAGGGAGGLTPRIEGKAPTSAAYYPIATRGAAITTPGTYKLDVYPGITAATDAFSAVLSRTIRFVVAAADTTSYTYSVDMEYLT